MWSYRYRIYPDKKRLKNITYTMDLCKELHNELLKKCEEKYKNDKSLRINRKTLNNFLKEITVSDSRFDVVYSQVLQNVFDRLIKSYSSFFKRVKKKKSGKMIEVGFPREKRFYKSITYPQNNGSFSLSGEKRLHVSKLGSFPIVLHRPIEGKIKTLTIKRNKVGQYFASFSIDLNKLMQHKHANRQIGIDLGINSYAALSDGTKIENPRFLTESEDLLKIRNRKLSKKKKGSKNRIRAKYAYAKTSLKITNQRQDFLHKLSSHITNDYDLALLLKSTLYKI